MTSLLEVAVQRGSDKDGGLAGRVSSEDLQNNRTPLSRICQGLCHQVAEEEPFCLVEV